LIQVKVDTTTACFCAREERKKKPSWTLRDSLQTAKKILVHNLLLVFVRPNNFKIKKVASFNILCELISFHVHLRAPNTHAPNSSQFGKFFGNRYRPVFELLYFFPESDPYRNIRV
jgi:hypothetical protein